MNTTMFIVGATLSAILLVPFFAYVISKMVTLGNLNAKRFHEKENLKEKQEGDESS